MILHHKQLLPLATSCIAMSVLGFFLASGLWVLESSAESIQAQILTGQQALYHGRFDEALNHFTNLTQSFPDDPKSSFFLALTYRWLTRIDPDSETFQEQFEQTAQHTIALSKVLLDNNPKDVEALLYLAAMYGYRAEYYYFLKDRWNAAYRDGVNMRKYLDRAKDIPATYNVDVQLGYGLYNYYAYEYRKKIGWWKFLLEIPKGDKEKGLNQINIVRRQGTYLNVEAWFFLIDIYKRDSDFSDRAIPLCEALHQTYPEHPYFHIFLAGLYHTHQDWQNSFQNAQEILAHASTSPYYSNYIVYQARYLMGESSFYLGEYEEALRQFDAIIMANPTNPSYLVPWSHLRRGTIYNLSGKKVEAAAEYRHVLALDNTLNVHDIARAFLKNQKDTRSN